MSTSEARSTAPRGQDHDRGLQFLQAHILTIHTPFPSICRLCCQLPEAADLALWQPANLALRIQLGEAADSPSRIYTVRDMDLVARRFNLDVVLHGHATPMLEWIEQRRPGDAFSFAGPRPHLQVPQDEAKSAVLLLDATGVPAAHSLLQQWPGGEATLWVASDEGGAVDELPAVTGVQIRRVPASTDLAELGRQQIQPDQHVVWAAGEREQMRALRRDLQAQGMQREQLAITAYWKQGQSSTVVDERRVAVYERLLARGGTLEQFDDLDDEI